MLFYVTLFGMYWDVAFGKPPLKFSTVISLISVVVIVAVAVSVSLLFVLLSDQ